MKLSVGGICRSFYWANDRFVSASCWLKSRMWSRWGFLIMQWLSNLHSWLSFAFNLDIAWSVNPAIIRGNVWFGWCRYTWLLLYQQLPILSNVGILGTRQEWRLLGYNFSTYENRADLIKVIFYEEIDRFLLKFSILKIYNMTIILG